MTSLFTADLGAIEIATQAWCWEQLRATDEGILSFYAPTGRLSLAASYRLSGEQVQIAADPFDGAGWSAAGYEMTLEIAGSDHDDLRWLVRATGMARRAERSRLRPATTVPSSGLLLPSVRVRGYFETFALDAASWDGA